MRKIISWIIDHKKLVLSFLTALFALLGALFGFSSCGLTKAVVRNNSEGTQTTVTVSTSNPTTVQVNPTVSLDINKDTSKLNLF